MNCFVTAPIGTSDAAVRRVLQERGISITTTADIDYEIDSGQALERLISRAQLVIGFFPSYVGGAWTAFEIGFAVARKIPVLLVVEPGARLPPSLAHLMVVRADPNDNVAIGFALDQYLASRKLKLGSRKVARTDDTQPLGRLTAELIEQAAVATTEAELIAIIIRALHSSGLQVMAQPMIHNLRPDIVVWSDGLAASIGNPFIIEIKRRIGTDNDLFIALEQVNQYMERAGSVARFGLLLWAEGYPDAKAAAARRFPTVLVESVNDFLAGLQTSGFDRHIRALRNERVHGAP